VIIELINTGTELMLGRVLNTHAQWLCRQLADHGWQVTRQTTVADTGADIEAAVREALARADLVLTTGGLGPTSDDLTRERIAHLLGKQLRENPDILAHITNFFTSRNRSMPERTRVQALVPEGALVLQNPHGTAPGLALEVRPNPFRPGGAGSWLLMLPGPTRELRPMFADAVLPLLCRVLPPPTGYVSRTLRSTGIGESLVEERIAGPLEPVITAGLEVGYCARPGQVDVRLSAKGSGGEALVQKAGAIVRSQLPDQIYTDQEEELESVLIHLLTARKETLALAESCTGGCLSHRLTNVPGASAVLLAGLVTYSNAAKQKFLGVEADTLAQHGAVSELVARQMAEGARQRTGAHYALSITGIAGPDGGTPDKPIGTVFIGLAGPFETIVQRYLNAWDRETFKQVTAQQAMDLLRRNLRLPPFAERAPQSVSATVGTPSRRP
jgi:nicotinamide-nucleotide amidase